MTQEEAEKIANIIRGADNGCSVCVGSLCDALSAAGLGFVFTDGPREEVRIPFDYGNPEEDYYSSYRPIVTVTPS